MDLVLTFPSDGNCGGCCRRRPSSSFSGVSVLASEAAMWDFGGVGVLAISGWPQTKA